MKVAGTILFSLLLIAVATGQAQETTLIGWGSNWRYLDDGSNQGTAWRSIGFNHSSWPVGPAQLGYGDGDEARVTGYIDVDPNTGGTQKNATTYFRRNFTIASTSGIASATLTLLFDDGAAVFINGTAVARTSNLPTGAAFNTYATALSAENQTQSWSIPTALLMTGVNTVAVEIHQVSNTSSDISFDLTLVASATAQATRGPYLQQNHATGITLRWRTDIASDSKVLWGTAPGALTFSQTDGTIMTDHVISLQGLQPDTQYFYAVGSSSGLQAGGSSDYFFRTSPLPGTDRPARLWILGDAGSANSNQQAVRNAYYNSPEFAFNDMVILLGDNAYETGTDVEYQNALFNMYPSVLRQSPVWSCLGNHETADATSGIYAGTPYFDLFTFPTNAESGGYASGTERYFSWDFGNIHFLSLDSQTTDTTFREDMLTWLENDLAANTRRWTIALWHHPPYSKGSHDSDFEEQLIWARVNLIPRLEAAGVDLVLTGHSHNYERSWFIDGFRDTPTLFQSGTVVDNGDGSADGTGVYGKDYGSNLGAVYAVAGSSGKLGSWSDGSTEIVNPSPHPLMFKSLLKLGSMIIEIDGNRLEGKFITSTGAIDDEFTIEKGPLVTVATPVPQAAEYGPVEGQFTVTRSGVTTNPLSVELNIGGTAPPSRYSPIAVPVTIPGGSASASINVTPLPDTITQGIQTLTVTAEPDVGYRIGGGGALGTVTIADTPPDALPIARWHLEKFGADANTELIRGNLRDPDRDGISNIFEYAFDLEPLEASTSGLPSADATGDYLTLTIQKNPSATDVSFEVQVSSQLTTPGDWSAAETTILQDTSSLLQVRDNMPVAGAQKRFIRLQVMHP